EVGVVAVRVLAHDAVVALEAANLAVGQALELAAEVGEHLERSDRVGRLADAGRAPVGQEGGVEACLDMRRGDLAYHAEEVVVVVDERLVVLEGQRHPGVAGVAGALDEGVAAPAPDLLGRELLVDYGPVTLGDLISGELRVTGHAPPGQEDTQGRGAEVGR